MTQRLHSWQQYPENLRPAGPSDPSGTPVAHRAFASFHQHRHFAHPLGEFQHLIQMVGVIHHVPIIHRVTFLLLGLPGPLGEGSTALAEDDDLLAHGILLNGR